MGGDTPKEQTTTQKEQTTGKTTGQTTTQGQTAGTSAVSLPDYLQSFVPGAIDTTAQGLAGFAQGANQYQIPQETLQGLQATAGGDYLYGGPQQQAYIDASVRSAMPSISSQFEMAGRPGAGLYSAAIGQQAQDAFARLFSEERGRQQQAQQLLPGITMLPLQLQQQLAQLAGGLPGGFASLFGQNVSGTSSGSTKTKGTTTGSGTTTTSTPIQQPGIADYLIPGALGVASLAVPGAGGVSAGANIAKGFGGLLGMV